MAHRKPGFRFPDDWTAEEIEDIHSDYLAVETIPVNVNIEVENRVYDFGTVEKYLRKAHTIAIQDCKCRSERRHCDAPVDVCILLNWRAEKAITRGTKNVRVASIDDAINALRRGNEAGLVLTSIIRKGDDAPNTICSCCSCCCYTLSGMLRFGLSTHMLSSSLVASEKNSGCIDCGQCVDRCHFGAREMVEGEMIYDSNRCFGCGLCVSTCPTKTVSMRQRI
jgi:Pyruvate/2-oxoacid:ferredoxin oxidoreductase delta subunit